MHAMVPTVELFDTINGKLHDTLGYNVPDQERWWFSPQMALNHEKPIILLLRGEGDKLITILNQLEAGVYI